MFSSAGGACGIKGEGRSDAGLLVAERPVAWAGTFTRNAAAAAPVRWSRSLRGREVRAIVVNSGNANACTGDAGTIAVGTTAEAVASSLGCDSREVLVASTGPIGEHLPVDLLCAAVPDLVETLHRDVEPFASAILTTDTRIKVAERSAGGAHLVGVAKGAAMLAPNMATMLAFIATDAAVGSEQLSQSLDLAVARSFNRVCVDACESTNDSVFLLAGGEVDVDQAVFSAALGELCKDLAAQMVADAEGKSRVLRIMIEGATDEESAADLGRAIASSVLWRAAVYGGDPNWGRILSALGSFDRTLDLDAVEVTIGAETVFSNGSPDGSRAAAAAAMSLEEVDLVCRVGSGPGRAQILTTDLTPDYVTLNAFGTS
ncbi:MAG TPA: bifunctional glutamate N-acetyltransferase/amino-acid acetyltransferase ArgJ [Actinomycetota bacterium]|nr:bifunctional glutamate N-acetyltransferase/amino-acid acetyltransferase ArgJ [Actinomycetota bacterium]